MNYKIVRKGTEIVAISLMVLGLVFLYIYNTLRMVGPDSFNVRYFYYVFIFSLVFLVARIVVTLKEEAGVFLRTLFSIVEISMVVYFVLTSVTTTWAYFVLGFIILYSTVNYGKNYGLAVLIFGSIACSIGLFLNNSIVRNERFLEYYIMYTILVFATQAGIWYVASLMNKHTQIQAKRDEEQHKVYEEQTTINKKLEIDLLELKQYAENIELSNRKLEETNQRLNKSAAEFYTLQQISQAIATILDIKELLKFVNDVIIGVMGVSYSTILLLDKENNKMNIKITNIYSDTALNILKENADCEILNNVVKNGKSIIENNVNEEKYCFVKGRGVQSMLCIPLSSKNESYGLVLVEQEMPDAFADEHLKFLSAIGNQISVALENVGLYEKMQRMATTDALTKIYNRLYFNEMLSKEMAKADQQKYPMCIAIFDIDHFKKFNDTYGHLFGDLVLKTIAKLAKDTVREQGIVSRFGGEEFVIILPNINSDQALEIIEDLRTKVSKYHVRDGSISASVTASFGISCYPNHGITEAEVLSAADTALYRAKMDGRNCVRIYEQAQ